MGIQRRDSYITYGGGGANSSVHRGSGMEMAGSRRCGDGKNYRSVGGGGGAV